MLSSVPGESTASLLNAPLAAAAATTSETLSPLAAAGDNFFSELTDIINGVSPEPSTPGDFVGFSGEPSLIDRILVAFLDVAAPFERALGIDFETTLTPLLASNTPPSYLTAPEGISVTETQYDGMPVYELTPSDASGDYVVAIHGGAYVEPPTLLNWLSYTDMAHTTGATIIVPEYALAGEGGTAATVEPEIAGLISSEIGAEGANHVSVYGDSAGGGIALAAVELLVKEGLSVPNSMVLDSPSLDVALNNPDISLVDDPVLNLTELQADGQLWAGDLPENDPLVSPLYGSLEGLPTTYVYSGSDELLAPDALTLEQDAIAQDAPFSFILRTGEIHDWALIPLGDGGQVQSQIYQELGLTTGTSASSANTDSLDGLWSALQTWGTDLSSETSGGLSAMLSMASTEMTNLFAALPLEAATQSNDMSTWATDLLAAF